MNLAKRLLLALGLILSALVPAWGDGESSVVVRTGEHEGFSRIVFDWPVATTAAARELGDGSLIVVFGRPAAFDLRRADVRALGNVRSIVAVSDRRTIRVETSQPRRFKLFQFGQKVVLDLYADAGPPAPTYTASENAASASAAVDNQHVGAAGDALGNGDSHYGFLRAPAVAAGKDPPGLGDGSGPLFDLAAWSGGTSFRTAIATVRAGFTGAAADADADVVMARTLFAWRHGEEALSFLDAAIAADGSLGRRPDILAMRDALLILIGRADEATGVFDHAKEGKETRLWQGALAASRGDVRAAVRHLMVGLPAASAYPGRYRAYFGLLGLAAASEVADPRAAAMFEALIGQAELDPYDAGMFEALRGLQMIRSGHPAEAGPHLRRAMASPNRRAAAVAHLGSVKLRMNTGELASADAVGELRDILYRWQDDDVTSEATALLSDSLVALRRYDEAMELLVAGGAIAADPFERGRFLEKAGVLTRRVLEGSIDGAMDPLDLVAFFERNRSFLPKDSDDIAIARRIAGILHDLSLPDEAAAMLEPLIPGSRGHDRAAIGADLAAAHLANANAAAALAVLADTQGDGLPDQLGDRRAVLEARALAWQQDGLAAVELMGDQPAAVRKADAHWRNQDWGLAADIYVTLLDSDDAMPAAGRERIVLRAAAALLLSGRTDELTMLRPKLEGHLAGSSYIEVLSRLTADRADPAVLLSGDVVSALTATGAEHRGASVD